MEVIVGIIALLVLYGLFLFAAMIIKEMTCADCQKRKEYEENVLEHGTTLCHNDQHLYVNHLSQTGMVL